MAFEVWQFHKGIGLFAEKFEHKAEAETYSNVEGIQPENEGTTFKVYEVKA